MVPWRRSSVGIVFSILLVAIAAWSSRLDRISGSVVWPLIAAADSALAGTVASLGLVAAGFATDESVHVALSDSAIGVRPVLTAEANAANLAAAVAAAYLDDSETQYSSMLR